MPLRRWIDRIRQDDPDWSPRDAWIPLGIVTVAVIAGFWLGLGRLH